MKTAESILAEFLYSPDDGISRELAAEHATLLINNLKYEGFVVLKADDLVKQISDSMGGGQHE